MRDIGSDSATFDRLPLAGWLRLYAGHARRLGVRKQTTGHGGRRQIAKKEIALTSKAYIELGF